MPLTELNRPLGQDRAAPPGKPWGRWLVPAFACMVGLAWASIVLIVAIRREPDGGEPMAIAQIEKRAAPAQSVPATLQPGPSQPDPTQVARGQSSARQLESESGVNVVRPGAEAPGSIVITIPDSAATIRLAPAPDNRLVERTRHGLLPKLGPDGATPAQIYARPAGPAPAGKIAGRIAILVGGLGRSEEHNV